MVGVPAVVPGNPDLPPRPTSSPWPLKRPFPWIVKSGDSQLSQSSVAKSPTNPPKPAGALVVDGNGALVVDGNGALVVDGKGALVVDGNGEGAGDGLKVDVTTGLLAGAGTRCLAGLDDLKGPPPIGNLGAVAWVGLGLTIELTGLAMPVPLAPAPLGWCLSAKRRPPLPAPPGLLDPGVPSQPGTSHGQSQINFSSSKAKPNGHLNS